MVTQKSLRGFVALGCFAGLLAVTQSCKTSPNDSAVAGDSAGDGKSLFAGKSWADVQQDRQKAIDDYMKRRPIGTEWFMNSPLGVNGVPLALLTFFMEEYPDIWKPNALGFPPHVTDYDADGNLKPAKERRILPMGMGWTTDPATDPALRTANVFFSCAGCHTSRVLIDGKMKYLIGGPSNEVEPQTYASMLWQTGRRLTGPVVIAKDPLSFMDKLSLEKLKLKLIAKRDILIAKKLISRIPIPFRKPATYQNSTQSNLNMVKELDMVIKNFPEIMKQFIGTYIKINTQYYEMGVKIPFRQTGSPASPPLFGPRPGQMDAFGLVQGIIVLNGNRDDDSWWKFVEKRYGENSEIFQGPLGPVGPERYTEAKKRLFGGGFGLTKRVEETPSEKAADLAAVSKWFSLDAANVDVKTLWNSKDKVHANWDGNQSENSRTLASGMSSVGDPRKVDTNIHAAMNPYIDDLPPPAFPFAVNLDRAVKGKVLFDANCVSCHSVRNAAIYDVGTDMNRTTVTSLLGRKAIIALAMEACSLRLTRKGENEDRMVDDMQIKRDWCETTTQDESDIYRVIDRSTSKRKEGGLGYKADPLSGVWASAPYLHNGSVPTLYALLKPSARPAKFYRGNVNYNSREVGYVYDKATETNYPAGETMNIQPYDTTLRGNSNTGHDEYSKGWSDDQIFDLIEYMKTM